MSGRRGKPDATGRTISGGDRHVRFYEWMMNCAAWSDLSPAEIAAYLELERRYYPPGKDAKGRTYEGNNGRIGLSVRTLAAARHMSKDTAAKALKGLVRRGFTELRTPGGFSLKLPHAAEWRLTRAACDVTGEPASRAFMRWKPAEPIAERGPKMRTMLSENEDSRRANRA